MSDLELQKLSVASVAAICSGVLISAMTLFGFYSSNSSRLTANETQCAQSRVDISDHEARIRALEKISDNVEWIRKSMEARQAKP